MALVAEWKLNNDAGNTAGGWLDTSGNGNHLTGVNSPTAAEGHGAGAGLAADLREDSLQNFYAGSDRTDLDLASTFIISCWINFHSLSSSVSKSLIAKIVPGNNARYNLRTDYFGSDVFLKFTARDNAELVLEVTGNTFLQINTWYHIAVVYDAVNLNLYINGEIDATPDNNVDFIVDNPATKFVLGAKNFNDITYYTHIDAIIDDVRIYNNSTDITPAELYALGDDFAPADSTAPTGISLPIKNLLLF